MRTITMPRGAVSINIPVFKSFTVEDITAEPILEFHPYGACKKHKDCQLGYWENPESAMEIVTVTLAPREHTKIVAVGDEIITVKRSPIA